MEEVLVGTVIFIPLGITWDDLWDALGVGRGGDRGRGSSSWWRRRTEAAVDCGESVVGRLVAGGANRRACKDGGGGSGALCGQPSLGVSGKVEILQCNMVGVEQFTFDLHLHNCRDCEIMPEKIDKCELFVLF